MKLSKVLFTVFVFVMCALAGGIEAQGQTQSCSGPGVSYPNPPAVQIDMTCVVFGGASDAFTYDSAFAPQFQDTFLTNPITVTLDWTSLDTYAASYTVWISDTSGNALSAPVTFTPSGSGTYSAQLNTQFRPGMLLRVAEHVDVASANDQCFAYGYYCYFNARFTLHD